MLLNGLSELKTLWYISPNVYYRDESCVFETIVYGGLFET